MPSGSVPQGVLRNEDGVLDHLAHDLTVSGHARTQRGGLPRLDLDLHLEVGHVLHAFPHWRDLAHETGKDLVSEGLGANACGLADADACDLVLVDETFEVKLIGRGQREQQRAAGNGGDRRDRAALLDVNVEDTPR